MDELLRRLIANGFADIEGLEVTGTLPVRQDIVNEVLTNIVHDMKEGGEAETPDASAKSASRRAWWQLVNKLQVRLAEGKLIIDFELRR